MSVKVPAYHFAVAGVFALAAAEIHLPNGSQPLPFWGVFSVALVWGTNAWEHQAICGTGRTIAIAAGLTRINPGQLLAPNAEPPVGYSNNDHIVLLQDRK